MSYQRQQGGRGWNNNRSQGGSNKQNGICFDWLNKGSCRFGASCKYSHSGSSGGSGGGGGGNTTVTNKFKSFATTTKDDTTKFIKHLSQVPQSRLGAELVGSATYWRRCWQEYATLDSKTCGILLEIVGKTPGSCSVEPPNIDMYERVAQKFLNASKGNDDDSLTAVKTVADSVSRLLQFEWDCPREMVITGISNVVAMADSNLKKQHKDHRLVGTRLCEFLDDLEKTWRIKIKSNTILDHSLNQASNPVDCNDWRTATVGWLTNSAMFAPSSCPQMKHVYESKEHYIDSIHRLWVAMTFCDGHAALAPHCRSRGQNGIGCNSALWPVGTGSSNIRAANVHCRTRGCDNPVEYVCRIISHDALCGRCASRSIRQHMQGPGQTSSTHIYDCKVRSASPDGILFLSEMKSRNAPQTPIHWKTTKRLSTPNLVAIVRLHSNGSPLKESDPVKWGEIVFHGNSRDEANRRAKGEVAVNISSILELDPDYFEEGSYVAVIDCMSFVPEWIPVLKALELQKEARLPFNNGNALNLCKDEPNQFQSIVSHSSADDIFLSNRRTLMERMIDESLLEPICEIKRDANLRDELACKLEQLVTATTLDKMQLISFIDALRAPCHLVQGPPGTGKSYFGVVLVRALMIIRSMWIRKSKSRGSSPILVLSYKNLAIDSFLVDLVNAERNTLSSGTLIRIGGQCKDPRLAAYSESNAFQSDYEVRSAQKRVEKINLLKQSIQATLNGTLSTFFSYKLSMQSDDLDEQQRRKALIDATNGLMETVVRHHLLKEILDSINDDSNVVSIASVLVEFSFLELESGQKPCAAVKQLVEDFCGQQFIRALVDGVSHYPQQEHWGDIMMKWLAGKKPVPRCTFGINGPNQCSKLSMSSEIQLCDQHRCIFGNDKLERCMRPCANSTSVACREHLCTVDRCQLFRLSEDQMFCQNHACCRCIAIGLVANRAQGRPPRNVCESHPMCLQPSCLNFCDTGNDYCAKHQVQQCMAMTKKNRPCKGNPISRLVPYCHNHKHLHKGIVFESAVNDSDDSDDDSKNGFDVSAALANRSSGLVPCQAKNKNGEPCTGFVLPGSIFCSEHTLQTTAKRVTSEQPQPQLVEVANDTKQDTSSKTHQMVETMIETADPSSPRKEIPDDDSFQSVHTSSDASVLYVDASHDVAKVEIDEMDVYSDEGEHLQHLRDVFEIQERTKDDILLLNDDVVESESESTSDVSVGSLNKLSCKDPMEWDWEMSYEDRWNVCLTLMETVRHHLNTTAMLIRKALVLARQELNNAKVRAKARVYENKSIIGGTIVGCISRLESIRATRPFAVVVEEASEVLEPLLLSCLTESTLKLEMIGDHRQLQPSIMSRFDFEICNKINISMFQRLIEAPLGHTAPSTVLSVQRRMRSNICDLTRNYYTDVIEIEDHESCSLQKVGDRLKVNHNAQTKGREIPGIGPHLYLWTHNGLQKRSNVGISRINEHEARMACALVMYLVECEVPRASIAVLTPYKGQLMLIRDLMLRDPSFKPARLLSKDPNDNDVCRVSTIDRFQGDEEDIVICSLVVDEKSKTGFVKLVNRMIVMLSRARLGLFVLGNTAYFEQQGLPSHWKSTLEHFLNPGCNDSAGENVSELDLFSGIRSGNELPLCCPVHRQIVLQASLPASLKLGFCTEICDGVLLCGHKCGRPCHWPSTTHAAKCMVKLQTLCQRHTQLIECHQVYESSRKAPPGTLFDGIIQFYRCPNSVSLKLPCEHIIDVPCWKEQEVVAGKRSVPVCNETSITPYKFVSCSHSRSVTCNEYAMCTADPNLVRCEEICDYDPPCGHTVKKKCWEIKEFSVGSKIYLCSKQVTETLPRCGHEHTISCTDARKLMLWSGSSCEEVGKVMEGTPYGAQDYTCKHKTLLIRQCGHRVDLECNVAFSMSTNPGPCSVQVNSLNPNCGHSMKLRCHELSKLKDVCTVEPVTEYQEGQIPPIDTNFHWVPSCHETITLIRKCGHSEKVPCAQARKPKQSCNELITELSPLCLHEVTIPCHEQTLCMTKVWPVSISESIRDNNLLPKREQSFLDLLSGMNNQMQQLFSKCRDKRNVTLDCGHEKTLECKQLHSFFTRNITINCNEEVPLMLTCGHSITTKCHEAIEYAKGNEAKHLQCIKSIVQKCWNFENCNSVLYVPCGFRGSVACNKDTSWTCPSKRHTYQIKLCITGTPLHCPGCSAEELTDCIKRCPPVSENMLNACISVFPSTTVTLINKHHKRFYTSEKSLLEQCKRNLDGFDLWGQDIFQLRRIPCFRYIQSGKKKQLNDIDWFNPRLFMSSKMNGIMTKTFNKANLSKVLENERDKKIILLVGYATILRTKVCLKGEIPKGKEDLNKFISSVLTDGHDSMIYFDEHGFENLIVYDPYPILPICKVIITTDQLRDALNCEQKFASFVTPDLEPLKVLFIKPPKDVVPIQSRSSDDTTDHGLDDDDDDNESVDDDMNNKLQAIAKVFGGTSLEGLLVDLRWNGGIDSDGEIASTVELELQDKMQFINPSAAPFAAINRLRTLLSQNQKSPLLILLLALETSLHSVDQAEKLFNEYVQHVQSTKNQTRLHPWALIMASRIANQKPNNAILSLYMSLFPFQSKYLTEEEQQCLRGEKKATENKKWQEVIQSQWAELKVSFPSETESKATDDLLKLTGLRKVKEEAIRIWNTALQLKKMDSEARKKNQMTANYCFLGNPGTGKTTVCRLFAKILCDSGIRESSAIVEVTAQQAKDGGPYEFKKNISSAMGGVLFIDEAYDLDPLGDFKGKPIVNELLTLCENNRNDISVILAGYEDDFEKKFFPYNSGLKSRFNNVYFEDFDEEELSHIWTEMRKERKWEEENGVCLVVTKRMLKQAGKKGFGNAREVRNRLERGCQSAMSRLGHNFSMEGMVLKVEDVIGEDPLLSNEKLQKVLMEINNKTGWGRVKKCVKELIELCGVNYQRELLGQPPLDIFLNRLFLGNPGTGKTTCAKLYGRLLKELGFLTNGAVVSKTASDFVGSVVGESQKKTVQILENAIGRVLIIDEAYALDDSLYGKQVLDTLVEKVQGGPSDDIAVLLLGYEDQMLQMIRSQNPGLARRFPKEHAFYFDDYDETELLIILNNYLKTNEVVASLDFKEKALEVLKIQKRQANFGNAGSVELLVKGAILKASTRLVGVNTAAAIELRAEDIDDPGTARKEKSQDPLAELDRLFKMEKVKASLDQMRITWEVSKRDGDELPRLGHFVFTGSPGTGKTTVARVIANVLFSLGLIPSDKIVERSALELTAGYVGQTADKVNNILRDAKGGILFIDEAYNLGVGSFGKEACDTLVQAMTSDSYKDLVIVIAGYAYEIDQMLDSNQGLKSRFTNYFDFPDWSPTDCVIFFEMLSKKNNFSLLENVCGIVEEGCRKLIELEGWGNGRDVTRLWNDAKSNRDARVHKTGECDRMINIDDVNAAVEKMIQPRKPKMPRIPSEIEIQNYDYNMATPFADKIPITEATAIRQSHSETESVSRNDRLLADNALSQTEETDDGAVENENVNSVNIHNDGRDDGVSDEIWNNLQDCKLKEDLEQREMQHQIEEYEKFIAQQAEEERFAWIRHQLELEQIRLQVEKEEQERELKIAEEIERKRKHDAEMERKRREQEQQKRLEEMRQKKRIQEKLQRLCPCPMGFHWYKIEGGWRCGGGSHYVSNEELQRNFTV